MLKELHLKNIVLVESATIEFTPGFNVLSGESGSGKSAVMNALNLIGGCRADTACIRRGSDKGIVEAVFDISKVQTLAPILENAGIDPLPEEELLIKREITTQGKSRSFINHQVASLALLTTVTDHLFDVVGQHANQKLLSLDYHRKVLDLYGDLEETVQSFAASWQELSQSKKHLDTLVATAAERMRQIETCKIEIEEIEEANLKDGEEEEVYAEYQELCHAEELIAKSSEINKIFTGERAPVLTQLNKVKMLLEQLSKLSPSLAETSTAFQNALLEIQEVSHTTAGYEMRIQHNPERCEKLNQRLETINRLKRKYGTTITEIEDYLKAARSRLGHLESADDQIEALQNQVKTQESLCNGLAIVLTKKRKEAAIPFQMAIESELAQLNMPKVQIVVKIEAQHRQKTGDDKVEMFITPNVGEHQVSLRECASGGELSRMMISLQATLAGKEGIATLIFDEVDANIGGETATVVGQKLQQIGHNHQILCITHFPQVAKHAEHHLKISKEEIEGRTLTKVETLKGKSQKQELIRMTGG
jgi:DNA repair protein RecN (Recombination protein N)